jgi:hypothetical protein
MVGGAVARAFVATLAASAACGPSVAAPAGTTTGAESTGPVNVPGDTTLAGSTSAEFTETTSTGAFGSTSTGADHPPPPMDEADVGFIDLFDTAILECDLAAQNCGLGNKCTLYIDPNVDEWMGSMCVAVVPGPALLGEPCTVEGHYGSGYDDCERGGMCFYVDPATLQGTCVGFCRGRNPPWMAVCEQDGTVCCRDPVVAGPELLCLAECDPRTPACPAGQACEDLTVDGWFCEPDPGAGSTTG